MTPDHSFSHDLALTPLGAGDLIDRAVRLYRRYLSTFVMIAAPPVLAATALSVGWTLLGRYLYSATVASDADTATSYVLFVWFGALLIMATQSVAVLTVMGGASRNFVRFLLFGDPISFAATYRAVWSRFASLVLAALAITVLVGMAFLGSVYIGGMVLTLLIVIIALVLASVPALAVIISVVVGIAGVALIGWIFFLIVGRFVYIPQAMLVEDKGLFAAMGRSIALASGNVKRIAALFIFSMLAAYSALAIFYVPLMWYGWSQGIDLFSFEAGLAPAWFEIASQLIWQVSVILLSPVWMIGLCLLYVDERVRREGYDIELMAQRRLGDIPDVPEQYRNPLNPALGGGNQAPAAVVPAARPTEPYTTLGLK